MQWKTRKREVACLVTDGERKVSEVGRDLDIHSNIIHRWKREYLEDIENAFPGKGRMKPEAEERRKLKRSLADVTEERDILKKRWSSFQDTLDEISIH